MENRTPVKKPLSEVLPNHGVTILPIFWRLCDYKTFAEALADGAAYAGEPIDGWSALADVMRNAGRACDCFSHEAGNDIAATFRVDGVEYTVNRYAKQN